MMVEYIFIENYNKTKLLVQDAAEIIKRYTKNEKIENTICDHDAEGRATLERHGIKTVAAKKNVEQGLQCLSSYISIAGDEKPRLYYLIDSLISRDRELAEKKLPFCSTQEYESYCWQLTKEGKPLKELPMKINDHGIDCDRYACMYLTINPKYERPVIPKVKTTVFRPSLRIKGKKELLL